MSVLRLPLSVRWPHCQRSTALVSDEGDFHSLAWTSGRRKGFLDGKDFLLREQLPFADKVCQPEEMRK